MIKDHLKYTMVFGVLFFVGFFTHNYWVETTGFTLPYSLLKIYVFHAVFSLFICVLFAILAQKEKLFQQLGFIYLGALVFKITFFCMVFYDPIFTVEKLTKKQSLSLLIPIAIFLIAEVYFIAELLNKKKVDTIN